MAFKVGNNVVISSTGTFSGDGSGLTNVSGGGGGFSSVLTISQNTQAVKSTLYIFTESLTLTLPANPSSGDTVGISNRSGTTTSIIARNGQNIMSLAEDMTVDVIDAGFNLVYQGASQGWVIV